MKKIFLYLFIFSVLINVFTYMYFTKQADFIAQRYQKKEIKINEKQTVIDSLEIRLFEMSYYTLSGNNLAQDYIEDFYLTYGMERVKDSILSLNHLKGGNSLIGHDSPEDPLVISRLEFLNHRWILADFDNTSLGGQVLIRYYLHNDGTFNLEAIDKAFYLPKSQIEE